MGSGDLVVISVACALFLVQFHNFPLQLNNLIRIMINNTDVGTGSIYSLLCRCLSVLPEVRWGNTILLRVSIWTAC